MCGTEECAGSSSRFNLRRTNAELIRPNHLARSKMKNLNALLLTAALSGLIGGTTVAAQATHSAANGTMVKAAKAGLKYVQDKQPAKHSCKGKNDCKGKNTCKGKGGCATDGSKKPSLV